jgi:hypothetical protein
MNPYVQGVLLGAAAVCLAVLVAVRVVIMRLGRTGRRHPSNPDWTP